MITLSGLTSQQKELADLIWNCETMSEVSEVIEEHGSEAETIFELIMMEVWDQQVSKMKTYPEAEAIFAKISG
jgi:hypothetical protein